MSTPETPLSITLGGITAEGYPVSVTFSGRAEQIPAAVTRLAALGIVPPASAAGAAPKPQKPAALRQPVIYAASGEPCCPIHQKPLKEGRYGHFCSAKSDDPELSKGGYCAYTAKDV